MKLSLFILFYLSFSYSQSFSDYLKEEQQAFNTYKTALDKEWKQYKSFINKSPYKVKKPKKISKAKKDISKKDISKKAKITKPVKKKIKKIKIDTLILGSSVDFYFLNSKVNIPYDSSIKENINSFNDKSISKYHKSMQKTKYQTTIDYINKYKQARKLSDWMTLLLVEEFSKNIHISINKQRLLTWFLLVELGYDVKVAIANGNIVILANMKHSLYSTLFLKINGINYYAIFGDKAKKLKTYSSNMKNLNALDFTSKQAIIGINDHKKKKLSFKYKNKIYNINTFYSPSLIKTYKNMPQTDYIAYFNSLMDNKTEYSMLNDLSKILKNKSEIEAINILLRFVQKSFKYKTDDDNFGYEKVLFPEETIYYKYSDCEDRSLLFAYLIKKLLKKDVVLLKYSDHLTTAVKLNTQNTKGDSIRYKGKIYAIADPTYINANIFMSMPKYKNAKYTVIK
jgi:hypothetical protein